MPISGVNSKNAVHTQLFSVLTNFPKTIYESPDRLYLEPVRKVLVLEVRDFSRPPFFHTSPKKTRFFSILAFSAQKNLFLGVDFL